MQVSHAYKEKKSLSTFVSACRQEPIICDLGSLGKFLLHADSL